MQCKVSEIYSKKSMLIGLPYCLLPSQKRVELELRISLACKTLNWWQCYPTIPRIRFTLLLGKICVFKTKLPLTPLLCLTLRERKNYLLFWNWIYDWQNKFYTWSHRKIYLFYLFLLVYFCHEWSIQRGEGTIKVVIKCHFQSCFDSCKYAQNTPDQV